MDPLEIDVAPHPLLDLGAFTATFPASLEEQPSPPWLLELLDLEAPAPLRRGEEVRQEVRQLLRHGGYKPTGRGKPASEYLVRAVEEGRLASHGVAVDACNAVSLHSGLPISVVDRDRAEPPFHVAVAGEGARYVFNPSGQEIRLDGLLCLHDARGPCGNAVKDAQRTKTAPGTGSVLTLVWGSLGLGDRTARAVAWYRELLGRAGATLGDVRLRSG